MVMRNPGRDAAPASPWATANPPKPAPTMTTWCGAASLKGVFPSPALDWGADYDFGQVNSSSPPLAALGASLVQSGGISKRAAGIASVLMLTVSMLNAANCTYWAYGSGAL